jgi:hypothetical protein
LKLMKVGFLKNSIVQGAFPIAAIVFLASILLFGAYTFQMPFEKGIEIVRSMGYELVGDHCLEEKASGGAELIETDCREFMDTCKAVKGNDGSLTVYSDVDNRILFLLETNGPDGIKIYFCQFR